eukprot:6206616-Pleurochrysis_carterae.AAC.2
MAEVHPPHAHVNPTIRALFLITAKPPPTLKSPDKWSPALASLLERCLVKVRARSRCLTLLYE